MARRYIVRKRQNTILYSEFLLAAVAVAVLLVIYIPLHPAIGLLIAIAASFLFAYLFFAFSLFKYSFSILFSIGWALAFYLIGKKLDQASDTTAWVFSGIALCSSLWAHWDHFRFLKNASVYEYER